MRYIGTILKRVREYCDEIDWAQDSSGNPTEGISDNLLLEFVNEAQDYIQSRIVSVFPSEFVTERIITLTADTEGYALATSSIRAFANNKIISVEISYDGDIKNYQEMPQGSLQDRDTSEGDPVFYIRRSGSLLFNPIVQSAGPKVRVNFYKELDDLDRRRGKIFGTPTTTAIVLENETTFLDNAALADAEYICTVSKLGVVKDYGVSVTSYNSSTRTITIPTTTLTAVDDDYVVLGQYATSHSNLPDICERYLRAYTQLRCLHKQSSVDEIQENKVLVKIEGDIIDLFEHLNHDELYIPISDEICT